MKTILAAVTTLGLLAGAANAAVIGAHVGPVGVDVGVGTYHHNGHYYHHRHWEHDHWRYW